MLTAEQTGGKKDRHILLIEEPQRKEGTAISASTSPKVAAELMEPTTLVPLPEQKSGLLPRPLIRLDLLRILL